MGHMVTLYLSFLKNSQTVSHSSCLFYTCSHSLLWLGLFLASVFCAPHYTAWSTDPSYKTLLVSSYYLPSYLSKLPPSKKKEKRLKMKWEPAVCQALYSTLCVSGSSVTHNMTLWYLHLINQETERSVLFCLPKTASQPPKSGSQTMHPEPNSASGVQQKTAFSTKQ